jgi:hypothetical protein
MAVPTTALNENTPAGSDQINAGDNRIREYKVQNREIMAVDHDYPTSGSTVTAGQHKKVTLQEQADLGTGAVGTTILGSQTVSGKGELVYTDEDDNDVQITTGGKIKAENLAGVYPAANVAALATMMNLIYPVGYVITLGVSTNPGTLLGVGTWTAIAGKVIVGIDATQTEFDTLNETGGAKAVTLTAAQSGVPAHVHSVGYSNSDQGSNTGVGQGNGVAVVAYGDTLANSAANASASHENMPPYIVKYCWERTA